MPTSFVNRLITHEVIAETIIYGRKEIGFFERKSPKSAVGLNRLRIQFNPGIAAWLLDDLRRPR
jgi:hypothetical protein